MKNLIIPEEIIKEFSKKSPNTIELSKESIEFIDQYYYYYDMKFDYKSFEQKIFLTFKLMKKGVTVISACGFNGCEKQKTVVKVSGDLSNGCCLSHIFKNTNFEKYGVTSVLQLKEVQEKIKQKCLEKYGVENPSQNKEIRARQKQTCLERYGVMHPQQSEKIREKTIATNIKNHGYSWNMQSEGCLEKRKETYLNNYGVADHLKSDIIKQKIKKANIEKYGVENVMQVPEIIDKQQKSAFKQKEYIWKTGEITYLQGNENIVLAELEENGYVFEDVKTKRIDMPKIWYYLEGKKHRYYPDFYIPSENKIIEVKSNYIYNRELERNNAKFEAVKEAGYNFALEIR